MVQNGGSGLVAQLVVQLAEKKGVKVITILRDRFFFTLYFLFLSFLLPLSKPTLSLIKIQNQPPNSQPKDMTTLTLLSVSRPMEDMWLSKTAMPSPANSES